MKGKESTDLGECGGPCPTIRLCHEILDLCDAVFHLWEEVALANVLDHVLVDFIRVIVSAEFLVNVSQRIAHQSTSILAAKAQRLD